MVAQPNPPVMVESVAKPPNDWAPAIPAVGALGSAIAAGFVGSGLGEVAALVLIAGGSLLTGIVAACEGSGRRSVAVGVIAPPVAAAVLIAVVGTGEGVVATIATVIAWAAAALVVSGLPLVVGYGVTREIAARRSRTLGSAMGTAAREPLSPELRRATADGAATTVIRQYRASKGDALLAADTARLAEYGYALLSVSNAPGRGGAGWRLLAAVAPLLELLATTDLGGGIMDWVDEQRQASIVATFRRVRT